MGWWMDGWSEVLFVIRVGTLEVSCGGWFRGVGGGIKIVVVGSGFF